MSGFISQPLDRYIFLEVTRSPEPISILDNTCSSKWSPI